METENTMRVRSIFKRAVMSAVLIAGQIAAQGAQAGSSIKIIPKAKGSALQTDNAADGTDDYSTDARLVSYVVDRVILRNGLIVRRWRWTPEAKSFGMGNLPSFGIIAQDVKALHPEMVFTNEQGHLVIQRQKLMQKDASVAELVEVCGAIYGCSQYRQHMLQTGLK